MQWNLMCLWTANTQQPKRVGNQEFGGYSNWIEYAQNDPKGAEKAIQQHQMGKR